MRNFRAGAAKTDITPPLGTYINGDFVAHYAQHIHDPLYAKAVVFEQGDVLMATVVVDICVMPKDFIDEVKHQIQQQINISPDRVLISSTHTHAGGSVASVYLGCADLQYMKKLPGLIVNAVLKASQNMREAKIAWGSVNVPEHVLCRRYKMKAGYVPENPVSGLEDAIKTNPFGGEQLIDHGIANPDPQVSFLAVKGIDDRWIAVLANYSLHYVGDWDNGTISADYFGVFAGALQSKLDAGNDFVGIMSNGTSGDVNIWDFAGNKNYPSAPFEKSKLIGTDIAERVCEKLQSATWDSQPVIQYIYKDVPLTLRKPTAEELHAAEETVISSNFEQFELNSQTLKQLYAREQVLLNDLPDEIDFPVQVIKIGQGIIGALGAEVFAETGLWIKKQVAGIPYFTISLANSNWGYMPPEHEFANGGYETWRSRTSKLQTNAEAIVKQEIVDLINQLK